MRLNPQVTESQYSVEQTGFQFVTRSCAPTKDSIKLDDGRELPLFKLETSSESHAFYTGQQKSIDTLGGRVEKFRNKFAQFRK